MKGKRFIISAAVAAGLLGLSACALARSEGSGNSADNVWTTEKVYARAQELGYTGTLEELLAQLKGADGVGVAEIAIENENLIVKLTDGKVIDCGRVTEKSGVGLAGAEIDENGNLILTLSDGSELPLGRVTGSVGEDGKGIRDILLNEEGELVVYFTDDTEKNVGVIRGENGVGIAGVTFGEDGSLIFTMTDKSTINCGRPPVCSHTYSEWELGRAATCTSIGYYTHTCSKCGNVEYDFIEETGHVYDEWQDMISTCVSRWQVRSCTVCGDSQVISAEPVVEHRFSDGVCVVCGMEWEDLDLSYLDAYNGTYGYEYLGTVNNGEALQSLYEAIDREVRRFHTDTGLDAGEDFAVASIDYAHLGLDADEAVSVWKTYRDDNPLYYWLSGRVAYTADCITLFTESDYDSGRERYFYNNLIYKTVDEYSSRLEKSDTIYRKALGYHDFIIEAVDYAYTADKRPETAAWAHNILGVFEGAGAVCEGYARSFQILLNYSGIENLFVTGTADGEAHAWNLVRLDDGGWYWCDLTWDDRADSWKWGIVYNYFCVNDSVNTLWSEGGWIYDSPRTFLDTHTFDTSAGTGAGFLYELPARSAGEFSGGAQDLLNTEFTVDNCAFTVVGYNTVELNYIAGSGAVEIPETVTYNGITYTVISLGVRGSEKSGIVIGWGITSVYVPETVKFIWDFAFRRFSLENIYVDEKNPWFCSRDGVLFTKSLYTLISYPSANARTEYVIPDETYEIAYWSFSTCKYLETLTFGRNVSVIWIANWGSGYHDSEGSGGNIVSGGLESLGNALAGNEVILIDENNKNYAGDDFAVYDYGKSRILYVFNKEITSYNLPANLASVESKNFFGCTKLESFTVEEGNQWFGAYGGVLYDKELTRIIFVPRAIKGEVVIPDGVTSIGDNAFLWCRELTSIVLPDGVTSIGEWAFEGCSSLTSIVIPDRVTSN